MKQQGSGLSLKLGALACAAMLTAACTERQEERAESGWDATSERTEQLYNDIRSELRDARERGSICLSSYEELRDEWNEHTDNLEADRGDNTWREQMREWGDELGDMFDDMGDEIDRNC